MNMNPSILVQNLSSNLPRPSTTRQQPKINMSHLHSILSKSSPRRRVILIKYNCLCITHTGCHLKILTEADTPTPVPSKSSSNNYNASSTRPVSQPQHSVPTVYDNTDKPSPPSPQPFSHLTSSLEPPSSTTPLFAVQILFSLHSAQTSLSGNV